MLSLFFLTNIILSTNALGVLEFEDEEQSFYNIKELVNEEKCGIQGKYTDDNGLIGLYDSPWLVKILIKNGSLEKQDIIHKVACTGVLINQRFVLYTMQCHHILVEEGPNVYIRVDSYTVNDSNCNTASSSYSKNCSIYRTYEVEEFYLHPYYDPLTKLNDLAIIRLMRRVEFSEHVKPICLPLLTNFPKRGLLHTIGWNRTFLPTDETMKSSFKSFVISNSVCQKVHKLNALSKYNMCTLQGIPPENKLINYPVTKLYKNRWYLIGFTSYDKEPRIHLQIQNYLQWITETMGDVQCLTPFDKPGECILLTECPKLRGVFANASPQEENYLNDFVCEYPADEDKDEYNLSLKVCCGYSSNFNILQNITAEDQNTDSISNYSFCGLHGFKDELPWLAAIINGSSPTQRDDVICGGSVISDRYVLTSTQCIYNFNENDTMLVRLGFNNGSTNVQEFEVESRIEHPFYNRYQLINDIGLLRLTKTIIFSDYLRPICLPTSEDDYHRFGETFYTAGFGDNNRNVSRPKTKKIVSTTLITLDECNEKNSLLLFANPTTDYEFCTEDYRNSTDFTCDGDEGGPVMFSKNSQWFILGISSTFGCGSDEPPTHLKVFRYLRWIKLNMENSIFINI